ncbi:aminodeoxychorismate/anthranilate synthase component II [Patescibacteria group bacterium]|nr:aminodeoxychorismate/anthranilate synthase component II [Patescibacteria group bacterium]
MFKRVLLIDNFDSFVFNLADYLKRFKCEVIVYRNNIEITKVAEINPNLIVLSPGPGNPQQAGHVLPIIKKYHQQYPIFGVCLGHQAIIESFGGSLKQLDRPYHGKQSEIEHDGRTIYAGLPSPLEVGRYHSLIGDKIPSCLEVSAKLDDMVMGVRHQEYPVEGVQFHPESVLTFKDQNGLKIIANLVNEKILK